MSCFGPALRILWQALLYRVRKREANNLVASVSLMVAFALPWGEVCFRATFALLLNIFVYLMNDVFDIEVDSASPAKDQQKVAYLAAHRGAAVGALVALGLVLLGASVWHSWFFVGVFAVNVVIIIAYSGWIKRVPIADVLMMVVWGASMTLVGVVVDDPRSWQLVGLVALFSGCYEVIQVIRDERDDRASGLRTTAVLLGARRAAWLFRLQIVGVTLYGLLLIDSWVALALPVALLLPLSPERCERSWDLVRLLFGIVWIALLAQVYLG